MIISVISMFVVISIIIIIMIMIIVIISSSVNIIIMNMSVMMSCITGGAIVKAGGTTNVRVLLSFQQPACHKQTQT